MGIIGKVVVSLLVVWGLTGVADVIVIMIDATKMTAVFIGALAGAVFSNAFDRIWK